MILWIDTVTHYHDFVTAAHVELVAHTTTTVRNPADLERRV